MGGCRAWTTSRATRPPQRTPDLPETRAARRARREASVLKAPVLPALATVGRPVAAAATVVLAALLVLAVLADPVVLAAGLAWAGIVVAWGWPALHGSSSRFGSSLAIGVAAVLAPAVAAIPAGEPYLVYVPIALVVGLAIMFVHQIVRRDGRPRLTESVAVTSLGLSVIALGTTWMPLSRNLHATEVAVVGFVAIAVSALADLGAGLDKVRPWMLPVAMLLGGGRCARRGRRAGGPRQRPGRPHRLPLRGRRARRPPDAQRPARHHLGARAAVVRGGEPARAGRRGLRAGARHRRLRPGPGGRARRAAAGHAARHPPAQ